MISRAASQPAPRARRATGAALVALALLAPAMVALLLVVRAGAPGGSVAAKPAARAAPEPLLIIRPHVSALAGTLTGSGSLRGALAPSVPGANAVRLAVHLRSGAPVTAGSLTLSVSMPGMAMAPITTVLHIQQAWFTGTIRLPMFGDYLATVTLRAPRAAYTGTMVLPLPLPRP